MGRAEKKFMRMHQRMITLRNDFHGTIAFVQVPECRLVEDQPWEMLVFLSKRQARRVRRELCPVAGCTCGGVAGTRGPQSDKFFIRFMDVTVKLLLEVIDDD
jgi:hypothetical protein